MTLDQFIMALHPKTVPDDLLGVIGEQFSERLSVRCIPGSNITLK